MSGRLCVAKPEAKTPCYYRLRTCYTKLEVSIWFINHILTPKYSTNYHKISLCGKLEKICLINHIFTKNTFFGVKNLFDNCGQ